MRKGKIIISLTCLCLLAQVGHAQTVPSPDTMPPKAMADKDANMLDTLELKRFDEELADLTIENLYKALDKYDVKFQDIVMAQALLETGRFTSPLCLQSHNLFGLRHPSDGSYYVFDSWEESVKAYKDDVQYKYDGGDYYAFLNRIGYAQDPYYTKKVMRIVNEQCPPDKATSRKKTKNHGDSTK